jgi:kynureninase
VQPKSTRRYIEQYLRTWATKGVTGHFVPHDDQLLPPFVDVDTAGSKLMAPIVGALESEVAVMGSLTANLHFLMASFYRPSTEKYKIILEGKAFPSDHVRQESMLSRVIAMLILNSMQLSLRFDTTTTTQRMLWS